MDFKKYKPRFVIFVDSPVHTVKHVGFRILVSHFDYCYHCHGLFTDYSSLRVPHLQGLLDSEVGGRADL